MTQKYRFPEHVREEAFLRQEGRCAHCGDPLEEWHAHHVVPNQVGELENPRDEFLRSSDNCVAICETCHYAVHDGGHYRDGPVPPAAYFRHSHAGDMQQHEQWAEKVAPYWEERFPLHAEGATAQPTLERSSTPNGNVLAENGSEAAGPRDEHVDTTASEAAWREADRLRPLARDELAQRGWHPADSPLSPPDAQVPRQSAPKAQDLHADQDYQTECSGVVLAPASGSPSLEEERPRDSDTERHQQRADEQSRNQATSASEKSDPAEERAERPQPSEPTAPEQLDTLRDDPATDKATGETHSVQPQSQDAAPSETEAEARTDTSVQRRADEPTTQVDEPTLDDANHGARGAEPTPQDATEESLEATQPDPVDHHDVGGEEENGPDMTM